MHGLKELISEIDAVEEVRETHLSRVFIASRYVFKYKKPIDLGFVDFTNSAARSSAALDEVRLNRRLTAGVYLGCSLVEGKNTELSWGDFSILDSVTAPVQLSAGDLLVVMRRLPEDISLFSLVISDNVKVDEHIISLSELLAAFHLKQHLQANPETIVQRFEHQAADNFAVLRKAHFHNSHFARLLPLLLSSIEGAMAVLTAMRPTLVARVEDHKVVDGHGDLRAEHIYYEKSLDRHHKIQIIDCIEFSDELRQIDTASDIAFISMDLEYLHRFDLSRALVSRYVVAAQDTRLPDVLPIFKVYRALVRAKVHSLRASQLSGPHEILREEEKSISYLGLANRYTLGIEGPLVIMVAGLMGTGKSTVAEILSQLLHALWISSDQIRKKLFEEHAAEGRLAAFEHGIYGQESKDRVYEAMCDEAACSLARGDIVVLDATFGACRHRKMLYDMARKLGATVSIVECKLPREVALDRLAKRAATGSSLSDGRPELYDDQARRWEGISSQENSRYYCVETVGDRYGAAKDFLEQFEKSRGD